MCSPNVHGQKACLWHQVLLDWALDEIFASGSYHSMCSSKQAIGQYEYWSVLEFYSTVKWYLAKSPVSSKSITLVNYIKSMTKSFLFPNTLSCVVYIVNKINRLIKSIFEVVQCNISSSAIFWRFRDRFSCWSLSPFSDLRFRFFWFDFVHCQFTTNCFQCVFHRFQGFFHFNNSINQLISFTFIAFLFSTRMFVHLVSFEDLKSMLYNFQVHSCSPESRPTS